jgi:hypothetical protein
MAASRNDFDFRILDKVVGALCPANRHDSIFRPVHKKRRDL